MEETLLGKRKTDEKTALEPRNQSDKPDAGEDIDCGDLNDLDQPPLDLTGVDGTAFAIPPEFDIQSSLLLDILSDKSQVVMKHKNVAPSAVHALDNTVTPKESEWDMW